MEHFAMCNKKVMQRILWSVIKALLLFVFRFERRKNTRIQKKNSIEIHMHTHLPHFLFFVNFAFLSLSVSLARSPVADDYLILLWIFQLLHLNPLTVIVNNWDWVFWNEQRQFLESHAPVRNRIIMIFSNCVADWI